MCSRSISSQFNFSELDFSYIIGYQYVYRQYQYSLFFLNFFFRFFEVERRFSAGREQVFGNIKSLELHRKDFNKDHLRSRSRTEHKRFLFWPSGGTKAGFPFVLIGGDRLRRPTNECLGKLFKDDHLIQIRLRLGEIFMNQINWDNLIPKVIIMPRLFGQICINL